MVFLGLFFAILIDWRVYLICVRRWHWQTLSDLLITPFLGHPLRGEGFNCTEMQFAPSHSNHGRIYSVRCSIRRFNYVCEQGRQGTKREQTTFIEITINCYSKTRCFKIFRYKIIRIDTRYARVAVNCQTSANSTFSIFSEISLPKTIGKNEKTTSF